jgi:hypothetical protein
MAQSSATARSDNPEVRAIIEFLKTGGAIESRLKETSGGEREWFQPTRPLINGVKLTEPELIALLHKMEEWRILRTKEVVYPADPSEHFLYWNLALQP